VLAALSPNLQKLVDVEILEVMKKIDFTDPESRKTGKK
jgi:hypothetical protein